MSPKFAVAFDCGVRFGWRNGSQRFDTKPDAIRELVRITNASHRAGANLIPMKVVEA